MKISCPAATLSFLVVALSIISRFSAEAAVAPANDLCENAAAIELGSTMTGDTTDATFDDVGNCVTSTTTPGVWYTFVAECDGATLHQVSTCDSASYDTKISVFTGSCNALVCVAGLDDTAGCSGYTTELDFDTVSGTTYYILVHGWGGEVGRFDLELTCRSPSASPSSSPSPTSSPTASPSSSPSSGPTASPSSSPSSGPTSSPSSSPTQPPTTNLLPCAHTCAISAEGKDPCGDSPYGCPTRDGDAEYFYCQVGGELTGADGCAMETEPMVGREDSWCLFKSPGIDPYQFCDNAEPEPEPEPRIVEEPPIENSCVDVCRTSGEGKDPCGSTPFGCPTRADGKEYFYCQVGGNMEGGPDGCAQEAVPMVGQEDRWCLFKSPQLDPHNDCYEPPNPQCEIPCADLCRVYADDNGRNIKDPCGSDPFGCSVRGEGYFYCQYYEAPSWGDGCIYSDAPMDRDGYCLYKSPDLDPYECCTEATPTPTGAPTGTPTGEPTLSPSGTPTVSPTESPSANPSGTPTGEPTSSPSGTPTVSPTASPSANPSGTPTGEPTLSPSGTPTVSPTASPSAAPSVCDLTGAVPVDIVFVLDESGSVGSTNYNELIDFVSTFIQNVIPEVASTRIGVVSFSSAAREIISLTSNQGDVLTALASETFESGQTNQAAALNVALGLHSAVGMIAADPATVEIIILFTDGVPCCGVPSRDPCDDQNADLVNQVNEMNLITVRVGDFDSTPLQCLLDGVVPMGAAGKESVLDATFDDLGVIADALTADLCP